MSVGEGTPTVTSELPLVTFPTLAETSSYVTGPQLTFPEEFLLDYTKNAYNQRGFSNVTYKTVSLPRQMLTTQLPTMHFAVVGLDNRNPCVVGRSIFLTY